MPSTCRAVLIVLFLAGCDSEPQQPASIDTTLPDPEAVSGTVTTEAGDFERTDSLSASNTEKDDGRYVSTARIGKDPRRQNSDDDLDYDEPELVEPDIAPITRPNPVPRGNPGNWANTNDYPSRALQQEREGIVGFRTTIDPNGRVIDCQIISSSGHPDLDQATCTNVTRRARFEPALDEVGNAVTGTYSNRVRWQIPK